VNNLEILTQKQTKQIIARLAFEIFENNYQEQHIVLAGIYDKGYLLSALLATELERIKPALQIQKLKVSLDKLAPTQSTIDLDADLGLLKNKTIVLIDDVLNSGRTLAYSLKPFLSIEVKKIQVAVLVDRGHRSFPISADFIGYSLSTTLKEHIDVLFDTKGEIEKVLLK
jgi:pyrimidine operon attenuation protein/uracil phosphoribosyltransferase